MAPQGNWTPQEIWIRDFEALTSDAYLGLWEHMLTHDLAEKSATELHPDDPFRTLRGPVQGEDRERTGAMIRIVDVEKAFAQRPYVGERPAASRRRSTTATCRGTTAPGASRPRTATCTPSARTPRRTSR